MRKSKIFLSVLAVAILAIIITAYITFNSTIAWHTNESAVARLNEIIEPNVVSFELQISEQIKKVNTLADYLSYDEVLGNEGHIALINAAVKHSGLLRCAISTPDGNFITHDNKTGNVSNDRFFLEAMAGNFHVSDPQPAVVDHTKSVILFTAPIIKNGEIIGALTYSYLCDDMDKICNLSFLEDQGRMAVVNQAGLLLIGDLPEAQKEDNLLQTLRSQCLHKSHAPEQCLVLTEESGTFVLDMAPDGTRTLVNFQRLAHEDWYMLAMVQEAVATRYISIVSTAQQQLSMIIGAGALTYAIALFILWVARRTNVDKLTGAPSFDNFKRQAKEKLKRGYPQPYVFIKLDIKNFKLINRIYSFDEGDRVIKNFAIALKNSLADLDALYARVSIDDFIVMLPYRGHEALDQTRVKFIATFRNLMGPGFGATIQFPTGQYVSTKQDGLKPDIAEIFEKINFAHRTAKQNNLNIIIDYQDTLEQEAMFEKDIEDKMQDALSNNEFKMYLQPKYSTTSHNVCGAEALVRWAISGESIIYPTDFVPVFERNGFIVQIDMYMFRCAVMKIRSFLDKGIDPITISVNFSRDHLTNVNFVDELCAIADEFNVPHHYLEIELTESIVFDNVDLIISLLDKLHEVGFTLSLDDFGSGYSSLGLLKDLDVDVIKIDKGFFNATKDHTRSAIIVSNIMHLSHDLGIKTVAEGIELESQVEMLSEFGCDMIQGYYFARPMPEEDFQL